MGFGGLHWTVLSCTEADIELGHFINVLGYFIDFCDILFMFRGTHLLGNLLTFEDILFIVGVDILLGHLNNFWPHFIFWVTYY